MARKPKIYKTVTVNVTQELFDQFVEQIVDDAQCEYDFELVETEVAANPKVVKAFDAAVLESINDMLDDGYNLAYNVVNQIYSKEIEKANETALKKAEAEAERIAKEGAVIRVSPENEEMAVAILRAAGLLKA